MVTLVHIADSLEQLDADTDALFAIGREHLCQFSVLRYQQEDGLNTVLPWNRIPSGQIRSLKSRPRRMAAVDDGDFGGGVGGQAVEHLLL